MNSKNFRELERKFRVVSYRMATATLLEHYMARGLSADSVLTADTIDDYWQVPGNADFVRVRNSWGETATGKRRVLKEITVKKKDKGSNFDRLELNLHIEEVQVARLVCKLICGKRKARIEKREMVFFLPDTTVVSVCRIGKDCFLEVESASEALVAKRVRELGGLGLELQSEPRSLFEIYVASEANDAK